MKKIILILIPSLLVGLIVFILFKIIVNGKSEKGALQVTSVPESKVFINGTQIGKTPLCKCEPTEMLKTGEYTIRLVPNDSSLSEFQEKITVTKATLTVVDRRFEKGVASEGNIVSLEPLDNKKSIELSIVTLPQQAEIFLDGNTIGTSPITIHDVTKSDHSLKIEKDGYKDKSIRIKTAAGYRLVAKIYLGVTDVIISPTTTIVASPSATLKKESSVIILQTPTGFLRARQTNSLNASEVGRVLPGEIYQLTGESDGWFEIQLRDGSKGWVSSQYAEKQ